MRNWKKTALMVSTVGAAVGLIQGSAKACYYHWSRGLAEPTGIWPALPSYVPNSSALNAQDAVNNLQAEDALEDAAVDSATGGSAAIGYWEIGNTAIGAPRAMNDSSSTLYGGIWGGSGLVSSVTAIPMATPDASPAVTTISDPYITAWQQNDTAYGYSSNSSINSVVSLVLVNVQVVAYTNSDVYVQATGIPSYALGPSYGNDPNIPHSQNKTYEIIRNPAQNSTGTLTATGLGAIGIAVNGASIYNPWDGNYYNASHGTAMNGIWQQNANVVEASTFDSGPGHANQSYDYHYHQTPTALINQLDPGNTGQHASPLIGFAADGFPIFGAWGYVVNGSGYAVDGANGQPEIELMTSSYSLRSYTNNVRTDPAAPTVPADDGPNVSTTYPLGYYLQDYYYNAGSGVLNQYNMRYGVAPGYSTPIWAYYVSNSETINASTGAVTLTPTYPYIVGPDYFGTPDSNDLMGKSISVPSGVSYYVQNVTAVSASWNVDASASWSTVGNWAGAVADGTDSIANFGPVISTARTVTVDSAQTVGTINFTSASNYTIAGTKLLTMNASTGQAGINVTTGSPVVSAPLLLLAPTTITVTPSTSSLTLSNLQSSNISLTTAGAGTVSVNNLRFNSLNISSGTVSVIAGGTNSSTSVLSALTIASSATLNLNNNSLIVHNASLGTITALVSRGFDGGGWNGTGITSLSTTGNTALGVILNNNGSGGVLYSTFKGQPAILNDVLIKYTYFGDTNLDGKVDGSDYSRIDTAYQGDRSNSAAYTGWYNGDFNYDGAINGSDYTLMDNAFNLEGGQFTAELANITAQTGGSPVVTAVPETASLAMYAIAATALLGRRSRRGVCILSVPGYR